MSDRELFNDLNDDIYKFSLERLLKMCKCFRSVEVEHHYEKKRFLGLIPYISGIKRIAKITVDEAECIMDALNDDFNLVLQGVKHTGCEIELIYI